MRKYTFPRVVVLLICTLSFSLLFAQERRISGTVADEKGTPLSGATVAVKNTKLSTTTNPSGEFTITLPSGSNTLTISYVGMETQEVNVKGRNTADVTLKATTSTLNDVVVVGYGTRRRAEVTSSISSISERDIRNIPVPGVDQALQGKVAGVTVTNNSGQPGGGVSVRVRGITSVNGNEPLYVIDGVPILTTTVSIAHDQLGGKAGQTQQSVLATLNPNDIASVDILKDASAQAIYGSQGANGVILITTKRGRSGAEGKISYDVYYGQQRIQKKLDILNLSQFAQYYNSLVPEVRAAGGNLDTIGELRDPSVLGKGTDWQDALFQTGNIQNHQIAFSGGQGKTNYYFSLNYFDQTGIVIGSNFNRYSARFNLDQQVKSSTLR